MFLKVALVAVVIFHWLVIFGNVSAFFVLPFYSPWYIALPIMSYIGLLTFSRVLDCPITKLENIIRKRMGLPEITGFLKQYLFKPLKRAKIRRKYQKNS